MTDWLSGLVGENAAHIISFIGLFVIFLVAVLFIFSAIKRMTASTDINKTYDTAPRLTVTDAAAIDGQRRLVLVRRDDVEHLILIGGPSDIVIETNIGNHQEPHHDAQVFRGRQGDFSAPDMIAPQPQNPAPAISPAAMPAADIIAAVPPYQPVAENPGAAIHNPAPTVQMHPAQAQAQPQVQAQNQAQLQSQSQPLQTHTQQMAAARQQQAHAPRKTEATAPKLHPAYPLGQVSRGVVAATSGLAAANNAAQQELIAAAKLNNRSANSSLENVRPGSAQAENKPLALQRATPAARTAQKEPAFETPMAPAQGKASPAAPQADFELDLENAVAEALSTKDISADNGLSFEELLSSEMDQHFSNNEKPSPQVQKPQGSAALNISARDE